jgi:hypothetical protein
MKKKLLDLVEALRAAGQQSRPCAEHFMKAESRDKAMLDLLCIDEHNAAVDAAAKELVAEIGQLPKWDCRECRRDACPHSGPAPARPGPPCGCSSFHGGPA